MTLDDGLWIVVGYLCGSVPFGLLIGLGHGVDIRKAGSGNVGATNCGRVLGRRWGFFCFALDVIKGLAPVLGAGIALGYLGNADLTAADAWCWLAVGAAAVLGHVFPVWLNFRGGKGVATGLGVLMGFWPTLTLPGLAAWATWIVLLAIFRYVSLASVVAAIALPFYLLALTLITGRSVTQIVPFLTVTALLALLVLVRHRSNLARVRAGTEPKVKM